MVECGTKSILQVIVGGWGSMVLCWVHWKKFVFVQWLHFFTRVLVVCNTKRAVESKISCLIVQFTAGLPNSSLVAFVRQVFAFKNRHELAGHLVGF